MTNRKIATYICGGCGLGSRLDGNQLAKVAENEGKSDIVRQHEFLCNAEGVSLIRQDIENNEVSHVVIAACSRRAKTDTFAFEDVAFARANLREGVIWHEPKVDMTSSKYQWLREQDREFTAKDVKYFVDTCMNPQVEAPHLRSYFEDVEYIKVIDRYSVKGEIVDCTALNHAAFPFSFIEQPFAYLIFQMKSRV